VMRVPWPRVLLGRRILLGWLPGVAISLAELA
jgi:hypothetical protein